MHYLKRISSIVTGIALLSSCYRSPDDTVFYEDLDMVQTYYNPERLDGNPANSYVNQYNTYMISDSIAISSNVEDVDEETVNDPAFRINIQETVRKNMDAYGYTEIPITSTTQTPDIFVTLTASYIESSGTAWYPVYWGGGYGYGGGYGWGGGWYYPTWSWYPTSYSYDVGSMHIDWMDFKNAIEIPDNDTTFYKIEVEWDLSISGLIRTSTDADRNTRMREAIDQGFEQSPYLNKNK